MLEQRVRCNFFELFANGEIELVIATAKRMRRLWAVEGEVHDQQPDSRASACREASAPIIGELSVP